MALDFMAIISNGTYPTAGATSTQRAIYAVSWGLLAEAFAAVAFGKGLGRLGFGFQMN